MTQFEIHDDLGVLFKGSPIETMKIWDALVLFKKNKLMEFEQAKHLVPFNSWQGNVKILSVIEEFDCRQGKHSLE